MIDLPSILGLPMVIGSITGAGPFIYPLFKELPRDGISVVTVFSRRAVRPGCVLEGSQYGHHRRTPCDGSSPTVFSRLTIIEIKNP